MTGTLQNMDKAVHVRMRTLTPTIPMIYSHMSAPRDQKPPRGVPRERVAYHYTPARQQAHQRKRFLRARTETRLGRARSRHLLDVLLPLNPVLLFLTWHIRHEDDKAHTWLHEQTEEPPHRCGPQIHPRDLETFGNRSKAGRLMARSSREAPALKLSWSHTLSGAELYDGERVETFTTDWHFHEGWQLVAVTNGERHYEFHASRIVARPGDLVLVPPGLMHRARCPNAGNTSFRIATLPAVCLGLDAAATPVVWPTPKLFDRFISLFESLKDEHRQASEAVLAGLRDLLTRSSVANTSPEPSSPAFVRRIASFLLSSFEKPPSLEFLALMAGVNSYHLTHTFTRHVGLPPLAFHTRARLMRSRKLIAEGSSLAEASLALSVSDQSHFGRQFRRVYGMTPGQYQQSLTAALESRTSE